MIRLIWKNLWARRYRNGWLLAELIVVSIVMWVLMDPVTVLTHNRNLPLGFQADGLYSLSLSELPVKSARYSADEDNEEARAANARRILERIRQHKDVQYATFELGGKGVFRASSSESYYDVDSVKYYFRIFSFEPQSDYFRTFAFDEVDGQTNEKLDAMTFGAGDVCVTTGAIPGKQMLGYRYEDTVEDKWDQSWTAVATIGKLRVDSEQPTRVMFLRDRLENTEAAKALIAFRVKPGVNEAKFLHEFRTWAESELRVGNFYMRGVLPFREVMAEYEEWRQTLNTYRINLIMAGFFLISLFLGVSGTFWMQTRSRREEVGVMKSFGARSGNIMRLLLGEGWVLTTLAVFLGCFIYLQYGVSEGLYGVAWGASGSEYWVNNFWQHFFGVSVLVWVILLLVVSIGIYIPTRSLSKITPTEALRDE